MVQESRVLLVYDGAVEQLVGSLAAVVHCWVVVEHKDCRIVQVVMLRSLVKIAGHEDWLLEMD